MGRSYQPAALAVESAPAIGVIAAWATRSASRPTRQAADRPAACLRNVLLVLSMESPKNGNVGLYAGRLPFGSDLLREVGVALATGNCCLWPKPGGCGQSCIGESS